MAYFFAPFFVLIIILVYDSNNNQDSGIRDWACGSCSANGGVFRDYGDTISNSKFRDNDGRSSALYERPVETMGSADDLITVMLIILEDCRELGVVDGLNGNYYYYYYYGCHRMHQ